MIDDFSDTYRFLSNFFILHNPIVYNNIVYDSTEKFFQAMKSRDPVFRRLVSEAGTPGLAKRMGRQVKLRPDWDAIKLNVMAYALRKKFEDPYLRQKLIDTYPRDLVEGNWWHDNLWGSCNCKKCADKVKLNYLGKLLVILRTHLINGTLPAEHDPDF
jgi:hypothetical protein